MTFLNAFRNFSDSTTPTPTPTTAGDHATSEPATCSLPPEYSAPPAPPIADNSGGGLIQHGDFMG